MGNNFAMISKPEKINWYSTKGPFIYVHKHTIHIRMNLIEKVLWKENCDMYEYKVEND